MKKEVSVVGGFCTDMIGCLSVGSLCWCCIGLCAVKEKVSVVGGCCTDIVDVCVGIVLCFLG